MLSDITVDESIFGVQVSLALFLRLISTKPPHFPIGLFLVLHIVIALIVQHSFLLKRFGVPYDLIICPHGGDFQSVVVVAIVMRQLLQNCVSF